MAATKISSSGRLLRLGAFLFCCSIATAGPLRAQDTMPGGPADDTAPAGASDNIARGQAAVQPATTAATERDVSERTLLTNILHDQKDLWLFPTKFSHENHWLPTIVVVGVTAGLLATDAQDDPYFRRTQSFSTFNRVFSGNVTMSEILIAPASFYAVGLFDKDAYARKTGLLAGEALADVTILELVMKGVTRRLRPSDIPPYGNFSDTFFKARGDPFTNSSFPSGHTISAFAVATVIAHRYGRRRWVPFVAFGAAGVIGFSRITLQAHFPSDVFLGAALGYAVARFDVLRAP